MTSFGEPSSHSPSKKHCYYNSCFEKKTMCLAICLKKKDKTTHTRHTETAWNTCRRGSTSLGWAGPLDPSPGAAKGGTVVPTPNAASATRQPTDPVAANEAKETSGWWLKNHLKNIVVKFYLKTFEGIFCWEILQCFFLVKGWKRKTQKHLNKKKNTK